MITHVTKETFKSEVLESKVPTLVDFWATWCGPCKIEGRILEELDKEITPSQAKICKVDVDQEEALAQQFGVESIPTLLFYQNGEVVNKAVGVRDKESLKRTLGI